MARRSSPSSLPEHETKEFRVRANKTNAPYPAVKRREPDEEERTLRKVPKSRRPVPLKERSPATVLKDYRSGDPRDQSIKIDTYQRPGKVGPKDAAKNAMDLSGADSEPGVVLLSGNWFINASTDNGATFTSFDPTTVFPKWKDHDFCCDQI